MSQRFDLGVHHFLRREYERRPTGVPGRRPGTTDRRGRLVVTTGSASPISGKRWRRKGRCRARSRSPPRMPKPGSTSAWPARSGRSGDSPPSPIDAPSRSPPRTWSPGTGSGSRSPSPVTRPAPRPRSNGRSCSPGTGRARDGSPRSFTTPAGDDHVDETGEREGSREAKSWLELALSLLTLGEEEEAVAAYDRAYTLDPERASRSLFRPMLKLLTAVEGAGAPEPAAPMAALPGQPEGPTLQSSRSRP